MKCRVLLVVVVAVVCVWLSEAVAGSLGAGIMVGEPTGLSFKQWVGRGHAMDLGVAWSFVDEAALHVHADYLFHRPGPPEISVGGLLFYAGLGGRIKLEEDKHGDANNRVGVRLPLGVTYLFAQSHLDFFFEIAPLLDLAPATEFGVNGAFGIRYYFGGRPHLRRI